MSGPKRIEPSQSLLQGMPYVNAASTNIAARFAAIRAQMQPASTKNVSPMKRKTK